MSFPFVPTHAPEVLSRRRAEAALAQFSSTTADLFALGWLHEPGRGLYRRRIVCADTFACIGEMDVVEANAFVAEVRLHLGGEP